MPNQRQLRDIADNDSYYSSKLLGDLVKKIANKKSKSMIKVIDPCAGRGDLTPKGALAADIKPVKKGIKKVDFLKSSLKNYGIRKKGKIMFVMNPPFSIGDVNSSGWELFLNKAAKLCEGRDGSYIITVCYATKSQMAHIDKIDRHLHIEELHTFDRKSEAHLFERKGGNISRVPIIVQVWKWKKTLREYTPFRNYKPSKNIPFTIDVSSESKYFIKIWNSPEKLGEITEKKSIKKKGRINYIELKSLINGKKTKGSVSNKGGTIYALKIKPGYTNKIINWFKKIYKKNIWTKYIDNALSNSHVSIKLVYFVYENKGKLPTVKDLYGTKIVHHGGSTKKNKKTRKKRGGKRRKTRKKRGGNDVCAICQGLLPVSTRNNSSTITLSCNHRFHRNCLLPWIDTCIRNNNPPRCPLCRDTISNNDLPEGTAQPQETAQPQAAPEGNGTFVTDDLPVGFDMNRLRVIRTSINYEIGHGVLSELIINSTDAERSLYFRLIRTVVQLGTGDGAFTARNVLGIYNNIRAQYNLSDGVPSTETSFFQAMDEDIDLLEGWIGHNQ